MPANLSARSLAREMYLVTYIARLYNLRALFLGGCVLVRCKQGQWHRINSVSQLSPLCLS